jgi:hypothetical protein
MLKMRSRKADIAGTTQIHTSYSLGNGSFDTGSFAIQYLKLFRLLSLSRFPLRLKLLLWINGQRTTDGLGARTVPSQWTRQTIFALESNRNVGCTPPTLSI